MHVQTKTTRTQSADRSGIPGRSLAFAGLCVLISLLLVIKYYPLRPTTFVLSQYLWTLGEGNLRRTLLSSLAGLAWDHDPARFGPVVDLVSLVEVAGLLLVLAWGALRLGHRPVPRLALLLVLCSGAASHLLATRGSQDGFAVLALVGFALALHAGRALPAALFGALAVAIHEASFVYIASLCGLYLLLSDVGPATGRRDDEQDRHGFDGSGPMSLLAMSGSSGLAGGIGALVRRMIRPGILPLLAGGAAAAGTLLVVMAGPHPSPDHVERLCQSNAWIGATDGLVTLRGASAGTPAQDWAGTCGLQFKAFASTPGFVLRSVPVGALFAPVALLALVLAFRARLALPMRLGVAACLLLPALLPIVATDVTRFWSYMNLTAFCAILLLEPHLRGFGRVPPRVVVGGVLALWAVVAIGIDQWPTGWPQPPSTLPDAVALRFPTFRDALCAASRHGVCERPVTDFH